jgi:hypothetical protein
MLIASAFDLRQAPSSTLTTVSGIATCTYNGELSLSDGYATLGNPGIPTKITKVPGLPQGTYMTYKNSSQTEIVFHTGTAAAGVYGVIRNYGAIKEAKLEKIALALYLGIRGAADTQTTPSVKIVANS